MRIYGFTVFFLLLTVTRTYSQTEIRGTVYDATMANYVEGVRVVSTAGIFAITDTMGHYSIPVKETDSLYFVYNNKPTTKFPVKDIADPSAFNISIKAKITSKYKVLKEVIVYANTYRQDSAENREMYSRYFNYQKPGLYTSGSADGIGASFDLDEIINMFRFKRNKRLQAFRNRLIEQEEEKYVDSRFGKVFVSRVSGLKGKDLDSFLVWYRPSYAFCMSSDEIGFIQYILKASDHYRKMEGLPARKPGE